MKVTFGRAAIVATLVAIATFVATRSRSRVAEPTPAASVDPVIRLAWPAKKRIAYRLAWQSVESMRIDVDPKGPAGLRVLDARFELPGTLIVRTLAANVGGQDLGVRLELAESARIVLAGAAVLGPNMPSRGAFDGEEMLVDVAANGEVRHLGFRAEASPLFRHVAESVILELATTIPRGAKRRIDETWQAVDKTPFGIAPATYAVASIDPLRITRHRSSYTSLHGIPATHPIASATIVAEEKGTLVLDPDGYPRSISEVESLTERTSATPPAVTASLECAFELSSVSNDAEPVRGFGGLDVRTPGETAPAETSERTEARELEQRVAGLTREELRSGLALLAHGSLSGKNRWLWRASGYLILHPEDCEVVADFFHNPKSGRREKEAALNLLASAGHPDAQRTMRKLLAEPASASSENAYATMMQRFSGLAKPETESLKFVESVYDADKRREVHLASAYTLGGVAAGLASSGDREAAQGVAAKLRADASRAPTPEEHGHMLVALGNTRLSDNEPTFVKGTSDEEIDVRRASVLGLGKLDGSIATEALIARVADPAPTVQAAAIVALTRRPLTAEQVAAVAALVERGAVAGVNLPALVTLAETHLPASPVAALAILRYALAHAEADASLAGRARQIIDEYSSR